MALVMLAGLPTSGKTHRAAQLCAYFDARASQDASPTQKVKKVHHVSEHGLGLARAAYDDRNAEKTSRAALYSSCKRLLGRDSVVVLDAGNYIKGFRYQLHCEAKAAGVRSCVVHVGAVAEQARAINEARLQEAQAGDSSDSTTKQVGGAAQEDAYDRRVWDELVMRFEEPNPMARWDRPLWVVVWDDADLRLGAPGSVGERVWQEVVCGVGRDGKALGEVKIHQATVLTPATASNHLHELDRITQAILAQIQAHVQQNPDVPGASLHLDLASVAAEAADLVVHLPSASNPSFAHLQRLRRQFVALHRQQMGGQGMGGVGGPGGSGGGGSLRADRIAGLFVDWLNDTFEAA